MATREDRLSEFRQDAPPLRKPVELLCEDHNGTYALPYECRWIDGAWRNSLTGSTIDAVVVGWRAVASWAKTMANELGQFNITVNNILPGLTHTQRLEKLTENTVAKSGQPKDVVEKGMKESIPMKRFGAPEEIGAVAAFLASPAASYINGVSIPVDGGRTGSI